MGTRALVAIYDEQKQPYVVYYIQFDGYPEEGEVTRVLEALSNREIVNGFSEPAQQINGLGSFALLVGVELYYSAHGPAFPLMTGGIYLEPLSAVEDTDYVSYIYKVFWNEEAKQVGDLFIQVQGYMPFSFEGTISEFVKKFNSKKQKNSILENVKIEITHDGIKTIFDEWRNRFLENNKSFDEALFEAYKSDDWPTGATDYFISLYKELKEHNDL